MQGRTVRQWSLVQAILAEVELWKMAVQGRFAGSNFILGLLMGGHVFSLSFLQIRVGTSFQLQVQPLFGFGSCTLHLNSIFPLIHNETHLDVLEKKEFGMHHMLTVCKGGWRGDKEQGLGGRKRRGTGGSGHQTQRRQGGLPSNCSCFARVASSLYCSPQPEQLLMSL